MKKLYVIADSISIQYGPYLESTLEGRMSYARQSGSGAYEDLNVAKGANGGDSSHVLDNLRTCFQSSSFCPDFLMINCGLHDIKTVNKQVQIPLAQ